MRFSMKKFLFILSFLFFTCYTHGIASAATTDSISQWGITWKFDKNYEYGKFANGDYWVVGPVNIKSISPNFTGTRNGWMVNPTSKQKQGFDKRVPDFSSSVVPSLPYRANPGESIVKSISFGESYTKRAKLRTIAILTIVDSIPPGYGEKIFRPGYAGSDKTYYYTTNIIKDRLLTINTSSFGVSYDKIRSHYQRAQIEHKGGKSGRFIRPAENMHNDYAPYHAGQLNAAIAKLNSDDSISKKWNALIYVLQSGIDKYNAVLTGQTWPNGGGHQPGHKLSVAYAAYMLNNKNMQKKVSETFWWENRYVRNGLWGASTKEKKYWSYMAKDPGYNLEFADPYKLIDGGNNMKRAINSYQVITANNVKGSACWLRYMPGMKEFWSDANSIISYAERWTNHGLKAAPDKCAPVDPSDLNKEPDQWTYYGVTWGSNGDGGCIAGRGRFPSRDGRDRDEGQYQSEQMNEMWELYDKIKGSLPKESDPDDHSKLVPPSSPSNLRVM